METDLFNSGIRPPVDPGLSVSRVGGSAQTNIIKKLGGGIRLALAQYRELAAFSQFASDLDEATQAQLARGERVTELMKQAQYAPMSTAQVALSLFAANEGYFDDVEKEEVGACEAAMQAHVKANFASVIDGINETPKLTDDVVASLHEALKDFKANGSF